MFYTILKEITVKQLKIITLSLFLCLLLSSASPAKATTSQTWKSWLIEQYFWLKRDKNYYSQQDPAKFMEYVNSAGQKANQGFSLDPNTVNGGLETKTVGAMQVHSWNKNPNKPRNQKIIFYLHGGSYLNNPTSYHIDMLKTLSTSLDARIILPIYPKAPSYNYSMAMPKLVDLYRDTLKETDDPKNITIMGDSAGGGLALGLALALKNENPIPKQPKDIILLSPWLDVTMTNPDIPKYESLDPILSAWGLQIVGDIWAGKIANNTKHPYVSPIYGDPSGLAPITMFVGTHEIFYPDILKYDSILKEKNHQHQLFVADKMNHVYPIYPIEEAKTAQYQIIDTIKKAY
ncbi:alpha/beta hydrolase [Streptococcus didelphis]|uniref:Alpha/beta hydrolase n=1 Tax=Streptococcus didelphis TaxID=102886 RepID=A0ABY9LIT1_9STRE|nr:alpha/beta hydrolase [Streptococcus didelphis]WMB28633.1 alpha/beta hydrolase [Streptococcus didelphis]